MNSRRRITRRRRLIMIGRAESCKIRNFYRKQDLQHQLMLLNQEITQKAIQVGTATKGISDLERQAFDTMCRQRDLLLEELVKCSGRTPAIYNWDNILKKAREYDFKFEKYSDVELIDYLINHFDILDDVKEMLPYQE